MPNFSKAKGGAAGEYYNPFYNQVDKGVKDELAARAKYVGATVRSGVNDAVLEWSYRKTAYGHVKAGGKNGMALGFDGPRAMTDKSGNLTLYDSTRILHIGLNKIQIHLICKRFQIYFLFQEKKCNYHGDGQ
jgi:hypothetical protein